jgi:hypothetical protein
LETADLETAMRNLTLALDVDLLRAARVKAVQEGTSVNEICRQAIARCVGQADDVAQFTKRLNALSARHAKGAEAARSPKRPATSGREQLISEAIDDRLPTLAATLKGK